MIIFPVQQLRTKIRTTIIQNEIRREIHNTVIQKRTEKHINILVVIHSIHVIIVLKKEKNPILHIVPLSAFCYKCVFFPK